MRASEPANFNYGDGAHIAKVADLALANYTSFATVKYLIDAVMEFRVNWPHEDPALTKLDQILQKYHPEVTATVGDKPRKG